jgi:hypothetical protein
MGRRNRNVLQVREDSEYPANDAWRPRSKKFSPSQALVALGSAKTKFFSPHHIAACLPGAEGLPNECFTDLP